MNYSEAMEYIKKTDRLGSIPGLASIKELCRRLGDPQNKLRFVHIAGTNGKGSTLAYVSTVLKTAGYKTGSYSSPAVFDYRERFRIDGREITRQGFSKYLTKAAEAAEAMEAEGMCHPTTFELETAVAFLFFADKKCDIAVLETGMGGLLDATNLVTTTLVSAISSVSMDHMQFLGKSLTEIAGQKAGIIKPGSVAVSAMQCPEVMRVIEGTCRELGTELVTADGARAAKVKRSPERQSFSYGGMDNLRIRLSGTWQIDNAVLAVEVIRALGRLGYPVSDEQLRQGLYDTVWPGRFTVIGKKPLFVVDGAHNADASEKLAQSMEEYFGEKHKIFIMGILRDKEYEKIISNTVRLADQVIMVAAPGNPRAMAAYDLAKEIRAYQPGVTAADSPEEAVEMAYLLANPDSVIVAFGSLSYLGDLTRIVQSKERKKKSGEKKRKPV